MTTIEDLLKGMRKPVPAKWGRRGSCDNYSLRGLTPEEPQPDGIVYNKETTPLGIILCHKSDDLAICAFAEVNGALDAHQFQGRKGAYYPLAGIHWLNLLWNEFIEAGRETGKELRIKPVDLEGADERQAERLLRRYDERARAYGFVYDREIYRYVLKIV